MTSRILTFHNQLQGPVHIRGRGGRDTAFDADQVVPPRAAGKPGRIWEYWGRGPAAVEIYAWPNPGRGDRIPIAYLKINAPNAVPTVDIERMEPLVSVSITSHPSFPNRWNVQLTDKASTAHWQLLSL